MSNIEKHDRVECDFFIPQPVTTFLPPDIQTNIGKTKVFDANGNVLSVDLSKGEF